MEPPPRTLCQGACIRRLKRDAWQRRERPPVYGKRDLSYGKRDLLTTLGHSALGFRPPTWHSSLCATPCVLVLVVGLFCHMIGRFCHMIGLFCHMIGLFCHMIGLFCHTLLCANAPPAAGLLGRVAKLQNLPVYTPSPDTLRLRASLPSPSQLPVMTIDELGVHTISHHHTYYVTSSYILCHIIIHTFPAACHNN